VTSPSRFSGERIEKEQPPSSPFSFPGPPKREGDEERPDNLFLFLSILPRVEMENSQKRIFGFFLREPFFQSCEKWERSHSPFFLFVEKEYGLSFLFFPSSSFSVPFKSQRAVFFTLSFLSLFSSVQPDRRKEDYPFFSLFLWISEDRMTHSSSSPSRIIIVKNDR